MHTKIDYQVPDTISDYNVPEEMVVKHIQEQIAFRLGLYIIENCGWITMDEIKPGKNIQKDFLFFPDSEHFRRVLSGPGRDRLLEENFI